MEKKTYRQKVRFTKEIVIPAKNAEDANDIMESIVDEIEFASDIQCDGWAEFEDEPTEDES